MYFNSFSYISFSSSPVIVSSMSYELVYIAQKSAKDTENSRIKGFINPSDQSPFLKIGYKKNLKKLPWLLALIPDGN